MDLKRKSENDYSSLNCGVKLYCSDAGTTAKSKKQNKCIPCNNRSRPNFVEIGVDIWENGDRKTYGAWPSRNVVFTGLPPASVFVLCCTLFYCSYRFLEGGNGNAFQITRIGTKTERRACTRAVRVTWCAWRGLGGGLEPQTVT